MSWATQISLFIGMHGIFSARGNDTEVYTRLTILFSFDGLWRGISQASTALLEKCLATLVSCSAVIISSLQNSLIASPLSSLQPLKRSERRTCDQNATFGRLRWFLHCHQRAPRAATRRSYSGQRRAQRHGFDPEGPAHFASPACGLWPA